MSAEVMADGLDPWGAGMERLRRKVERLGLANVTLVDSRRPK